MTVKEYEFLMGQKGTFGHFSRLVHFCCEKHKTHHTYISSYIFFSLIIFMFQEGDMTAINMIEPEKHAENENIQAFCSLWLHLTWVCTASLKPKRTWQGSSETRTQNIEMAWLCLKHFRHYGVRLASLVASEGYKTHNLVKHVPVRVGIYATSWLKDTISQILFRRHTLTFTTCDQFYFNLVWLP